MPWTSNRWPPTPGDAIDTDVIFNEARDALAERDRLVPAGRVPEAFSRHDPIRGTPAGGAPTPEPTVANFQDEIRRMLDQENPLRWWDGDREELYTFVHLCGDAFGAPAWSHDLAETDSQGRPAHPWTPALAILFEELCRATNRLDRVRLLPAASGAETRDSVYRLTAGTPAWTDDRAAAFSEFDGTDDGQTVGLEFDVGLGGDVFDDGSSRQWMLESRVFRLTFATGDLAGGTVRQARLDFSTAAPAGAADFSDTFTAEVVDGDDTALSTFGAASYGEKHIDVPAGSVRTDGDTVFVIRSTRADAADRPAWAPAGPDYTSTYREGLAVAGPVRLIVEVDFEYHG